MRAEPRFGRLLTAMVTPFDSSGGLDTKRAGELANHLLDNGTDALIVCGTTGEGPTVFYDQKLALFQAVLDAAQHRAPIIANAGDNCTDDSVAFAKKVEKLGVDAIMLVAPYYNKPPQEGLYQHFKTIANAVELPVILYNVPGRTAINITPETVVRLANDVDNIVAIKQANDDLEQSRHILEHAPQGFELISGDDATTFDMVRMGGTGVISVISHIVGPQVKKMIEATVAGDFETGRAWHEALLPIFDALFMTSNPIMVKEALAIAGFPVGGVRLPLVNATPEQHELLKKVMDKSFEQFKEMENIK